MLIKTKMHRVHFSIKKWWAVVLLLLAFIPLLFIDIHNQHDWGDDFAQYIYNAQCFIAGKDGNAPTVLETQNISPLHRGSGFSLVLAPFLLFFGNQIDVFLIFISCCLLVFGLLLFKFLKQQKIPAIWALVLVLIFVYNIQVIQLKSEILYVFPFLILVFASFILHQQHNPFSMVLLCGCTGYLISLANLGWSFYLALLVFEIHSFFQHKNIKRLLSIIGLPLLVYLLIKSLVFKTIFTDEISWYRTVFVWQHLPSLMWQQLMYYIEVFKVFFSYDLPSWPNKLIKVSFIIFMLFGCIQSWRKQVQLLDVFFIAYLLVLLFYPYQAEGMRFLLPLLAISIYYVWLGLQTFKHLLKVNHPYFESFYLGLVMLAQLYTLGIFLQKQTEIKGPQDRYAAQAFDSIQNHTLKTDAVAFCKPWTMPLYAKRTALSYRLDETLPELLADMTKHKVHYILLASDSSHVAVYNAILAKQLPYNYHFKSIWKNADFVLYLRQ